MSEIVKPCYIYLHSIKVYRYHTGTAQNIWGYTHLIGFLDLGEAVLLGLVLLPAVLVLALILVVLLPVPVARGGTVVPRGTAGRHLHRLRLDVVGDLQYRHGLQKCTLMCIILSERLRERIRNSRNLLGEIGAHE